MITGNPASVSISCNFEYDSNTIHAEWAPSVTRQPLNSHDTYPPTRRMTTPESLILDFIACDWHAKLACASRTPLGEVSPIMPTFIQQVHRPHCSLVHYVHIQIDYSGLYNALILFGGDLVARGAHQ
ncbi:hypothetical protein AZE42_01359 [Rhizopogon vesiculosus]|uniref:Uncharacterized protein n=1 Tax=Rhizopogon vesiculosus TaxID=180088 RepID=A0A1J8R6D1_9AGAM|nr:hypothetical protein AZE42_01359 [Rhizopogon vesiculosus]